MSQNVILHFTFIVRAKMFRERNTHQNNSVMSVRQLATGSRFRTTGLRKRLCACSLPTASHLCQAKMFLLRRDFHRREYYKRVGAVYNGVENSGPSLLGVIYVVCSTRIRNGSMHPIRFTGQILLRLISELEANSTFSDTR